MSRSYTIARLPGDGIGPEVLEEAVATVEAVAEPAGFDVHWRDVLIGGASIDRHGVPLTEEATAACTSSDAVLLGAVGGPAWDACPPEIRPERGLLALRKTLGVFANLRPVLVTEALVSASPLKPERVAGTDLLVVRELTGGIYFGTPSGREGDEAVSTMRYSVAEIERVAHVAFRQARKRRGHVTSVDKANVLAVSRLWREVVERVAEAYPDVALAHMYVDNAAMQLVLRPTQFDVILTGNLFGDILSDAAATLVGSLGVLPSASIGGPVGLFEPVHGSAPDIAGQGIANPTAAVMSAAMMLDELGETASAQAIRAGVREALAGGRCTPDLHTGADEPLATQELGELIRHRSIPHLREQPAGSVA